MNTVQRTKIRHKIEQDIESLRATIEDLEAQTQPIPPDRAVGRLSRMDAIASSGVKATSLHAARAKLMRLQRALGKVETPDFGVCRNCEEPSPLARLMLMPESTYCVRCAERGPTPEYARSTH